MKTNNQYALSWFRTSLYLGIALAVFASGALIYEALNNNHWFVESLLGQLGIGLLMIYFSGQPMVDERIRYLKFKALTIAFVISALSGTIYNYLSTYPDGMQVNAISSYWFVLTCLLISFITFEILKIRE